MGSILSGYEYDIFISYRQNDNKYDGWVTTFVEKLQEELEATIKTPLSIYFDENPHDGLLDTHIVEESLANKLKALIFIPVVSQTYCDPNCYAWQNEFLQFVEMSDNDELGKYIKLASGNVASRILPIRIHKLDDEDQSLLENELGGPIRAIDFVHEAPGVNRPLDSIRDDKYSGENKIIYRDQINKVANSIKEILIGIKQSQEQEQKKEKADKLKETTPGIESDEQDKFSFSLGIKSLLRRNIPQVLVAYVLLSIILYRILNSISNFYDWPPWILFTSLILMTMLAVIAVVLAWHYEFSPEGFVQTKSWESKLNPYPGYKKKPLTGIVTISALIFILVLQSFYMDFFFANTVEEKQKTRNFIIAVLPFIDETKNIREGDYFSKDLTESVNIELSKIGSLIIRPPGSTQSYTDDKIDYSKIASELKVSHVLRGNVRFFENQLRIICRLIDVNNNQMIWGKSFTGSKGDVFMIQNEIALLIAEELEIELSNRELQSIESVPTNNILAYDHYLKGREYYYKYDKEANDSAVMEFKTAIELDPNYALAWAGLGDAYSQRNSLYGEGINWKDSSIHAATRAVDIDPKLKEAYKAIGNYYNYDFQYEKALEYFFKAVEIDSNYSPAIGNIGSVYNSLGQLDLSIEWQMKSYILDPSNFIPAYMLGWTFRLLQDYDNAEKWLKKSLELKEHSAVYRELAFTYLLQGRKSESVSLFNKIISLNKQSAINYVEAGLISLYANELDSAEKYFNNAIILNNDLSTDPKSIVPLALLYFKINKGEEQVLTELEKLENMYLDLINSVSKDDDHRIYLAGIKMMQGKEKEALNWINRATQSNWTDLAEIDHLPWFSQLRLTPEYKEITSTLRAKIATMSTNLRNRTKLN